MASDFRKNMHIAYKLKVVEIIQRFIFDLNNIEDHELRNEFILKWVDRNCLAMGDFDKERAMQEIEEWSK